jgi:hypothetical protein
MCVAAGAIGAAVAGSVVSSVLAPRPSSSSNSGAQAAANAADPFASQREQYQQQLFQLMSNPSSITSTPGYQFGLTQSQNAVEGSAAANGMVNSGNVLNALSTNAQGYAATQLNNQELLLAQLSGANVGSPGTAGQILQNQNQSNQQSLGTLGNAVTSGINQGINSGGFSNAWNSFTGSNSTTGSENLGASSTSTPDDLISGYTG